jgi:hypothetical protein
MMVNYFNLIFLICVIDSFVIFIVILGGKAKPLKKPKSDKKDYDEVFQFLLEFFSSYYTILFICLFYLNCVGERMKFNRWCSLV